jgi:hypothetical protein
MAKRKTAAAQSEAVNADESITQTPVPEETVIDSTDFDPAKLEAMPSGEPANDTNPAIAPTNGHAAAVRQRRSVEHSKLTVPAGDMLVHLLDKGDNEAGIGIRITFQDGAKGRPTEEEKSIIRRVIKGEGEERPSGFAWNKENNMWHKEIGADSPMSRSVAIRLDAESRVERLAEELREHQADPVGFAEMVQQRREQAAQVQTIPD